jgi:hypothetical protein
MCSNLCIVWVLHLTSNLRVALLDLDKCDYTALIKPPCPACSLSYIKYLRRALTISHQPFAHKASASCPLSTCVVCVLSHVKHLLTSSVSFVCVRYPTSNFAWCALDADEDVLLLKIDVEVCFTLLIKSLTKHTCTIHTHNAPAQIHTRTAHCTHIHAHVHIHTHITQAHIHTHMHTHAQRHARIHAHTCIHPHPRTCTRRQSLKITHTHTQTHIYADTCSIWLIHTHKYTLKYYAHLRAHVNTCV